MCALTFKCKSLIVVSIVAINISFKLVMKTSRLDCHPFAMVHSGRDESIAVMLILFLFCVLVRILFLNAFGWSIAHDRNMRFVN